MFSKLGRFEIKGILGRGAMGEVYLGVDPVLGREVAIKTILSSALPEDQARQRFDREAKAAAVLNSPHIVTIHELGEDQGVLFIAMERLKGMDLEQILLERSLSLVESLEVLAQVCDGLDTAHRNHIIHRDIKPSNIMVMREGRKLLVKIMDFGVARLKDSAMTVVGTVMGTVNYIAPEYIKSGEPDARSDLFAVGVMLYECISGKKPFDGGTASTVLFKIVNDPPDPLDLSMLHGLSPALRNMTEKALAKDPDERFQSGEELALALRAAKDPTWSGKVEETTLRMKIRPQESSPASQKSPEPVLPQPVPSRFAAAAQPHPAQAAEKARKASETVIVAQPAAKSEPLPIEDPGASLLTQVHGMQPGEPPAGKTVVIQLPEPPPAPVAPPTEDVAAAKAGTAEFQVQPSKPPASKTVVLQLPEPPPVPVAPPTEEVAAAKAGTAEFQVQPSEPPASKTVVLQLPEPPPVPVAPPTEEVAAAKAGTAEFQVQPNEPPADKTVVIQLPEPSPEPLAPTEEVAAAKAGTAEFQVQPSEPPVEKTVVLQLPEPPPAPVAPTEEVAAAKAGTAEFQVQASEPPAGKTVVFQLSEPSPEPVAPTQELAAAKAGTAGFQVQPSEPPVDKTEMLKLPELPAKGVLPPAEAVAKAEMAVFAETTSDSVSGSTELLKRLEPVPPNVPEVAKATTPLAPKPVERDISQPPETASTKADFPRSTGMETSQAALLPPAAEPERAGLGQEMTPARSSKSPVALVVGLIILAVLGGVGYYFYNRAKGVPPPNVAPIAPTPTTPEAVPPPSIAVPETPAPPPEAAQPIVPTAPVPKPVKPPKAKAVKTPAPTPKAPAPAPAPVVVAPPPPAPAVVAPPPTAPVPDAAAKRKIWAAEEAKKRLKKDESSK